MSLEATRLSNYFGTLSLAAGCLATKVIAVHLLTARTRLMTGINAGGPKDSDNWLLPILKTALVCTGSDFGGAAFVERAERVGKNCGENEPFFLALATVVGLAGNVPATLGVSLIKMYTVSRVSHTVVYLLGSEKVNAAVRALTWIGGVSATLAMSACAFGFQPKYK